MPRRLMRKPNQRPKKRPLPMVRMPPGRRRRLQRAMRRG